MFDKAVNLPHNSLFYFNYIEITLEFVSKSSQYKHNDGKVNWPRSKRNLWLGVDAHNWSTKGQPFYQHHLLNQLCLTPMNQCQINQVVLPNFICKLHSAVVIREGCVVRNVTCTWPYPEWFSIHWNIPGILPVYLIALLRSIS